MAYHRLREAVTVGAVRIAHVKGELNTSDVRLSKPVGPAGYWNLLGWLLYGRKTKDDRKDDRDHEIQGELQNKTQSIGEGRTRFIRRRLFTSNPVMLNPRSRLNQTSQVMSRMEKIIVFFLRVSENKRTVSESVLEKEQ